MGWMQRAAVLRLRWLVPIGLLAVCWGLVVRGVYSADVGYHLTIYIGLAHTLITWDRRSPRQRFIESSRFPRHLRDEVRRRYAHLSDAQLDAVERGLRQFFLCHLRARAFVSMPSQVVDAMWHAFILDTRAYEQFCRGAFGRFLHHSPAQTLDGEPRRDDGLRRTWYHACRLEKIDPRQPHALPLLFALDTQLAIPDGYRYVPDCRRIDQAAASGTHCGTSFGDSGGAGGGNDSFGGEGGSSGSWRDGDRDGGGSHGGHGGHGGHGDGGGGHGDGGGGGGGDGGCGGGCGGGGD